MTGKPESEQQAWAARQLLAGRLHGVISTISVDMSGYPFGSVTPYCLDGGGRPVLLLSHLAQHTRNLLQKPSAALTLVAAFEGDVQQAARLTAVGEIRRLADDSVAERYFRYFPQSRFYYEDLNFRFFGLDPERWHWNSGFATARWFGNDRILRVNPFAGAVEAETVDIMENDYRDVLERCLAVDAVMPPAASGVRVCGVDSEGIDIWAGERIVRVPFPRPVATADELHALLGKLATGLDT